MEEKTLNWSMVPEGWALCYNDHCPRHEQCLRRQAALLAPQELTVTRCVTPQALRDGQCPHFASSEPVRFARGFKDIYADVLKRDFTPMRVEITSKLSGCRLYYDYLNGRRPLSPEQQNMIREVFRKHGYDDNVQFESYEDAFQFPWV